jgi:YD repeat-containing protein
MNEAFEVKGSVRTLEQRKQAKQDPQDLLRRVRDLDSFDVEFSPSGQPILETSYTHSGSVHRCTRFEYNEAGRLVRTVSVDGAGNKLDSSELTYAESKCVWVNRDALGAVANHGADEYSGKDLLSTSSFDNENRLRRVKTFEYSGGRLVKSDSIHCLPDGTVYERWLADYDSEGRIHKTYGLKADGSPLGDGKYVYEYDREGRRSKTWTFSEFADDNLATNVTIYEYVNDEIGNWIERHEYHLWRNDSYQSKRLITRTLTYYQANS